MKVRIPINIRFCERSTHNTQRFGSSAERNDKFKQTLNYKLEPILHNENTTRIRKLNLVVYGLKLNASRQRDVSCIKTNTAII